MDYYKLTDKETGGVIATIAEPEIASDKHKFDFVYVGDLVKLDPKEIKGSDLEGKVDLDKVFTVVGAKPAILRPNNKSRYQLLQLNAKVYSGEDDDGWSNSWFIKA